MNDVGSRPPAEPPPAVDPGAEPSSRRRVVVLVVVLAALVAATAAGYVLTTGGFGSSAPGAELEGRWSGTGTVASCEGAYCALTEEITLEIDCSWSSCSVHVFGEPAQLQEAGNRFTAAGSIPPWELDSCAGGGLSTGRWSLDLGLDGQTLTGRYTEGTTSRCGPVVSTPVSTTETAWDFELTRE
ncbi:hypothetical protein ACI797_15455 [Geodermatophilus sp. SYSU D00691]